MSDIPNISTPRANVAALAEMALDGNERGKAMTIVFYDLCANVQNHAFMRNDKVLLEFVEKARAAFQEAVK